jgi:hypothetical protein
MTTRTTLIFKIMTVLFWIVFIGLCIKTGSILWSYFVSLVINPEAAQNLYMGLNLSELFHFNRQHYSMIVSLFIVSTGLKAYIGYYVVRITMELKLEQPFSEGINAIITKISRIALWTGLLAIIAHAYSKWLMEMGLDIPIDWAYEEILFFAGVLFMIAQVFRKGIELQSENELTV